MEAQQGFARLAKKTRNMRIPFHMRLSTRLRTPNQIYALETFINSNHFTNSCSEQWRVSDAIEAKNSELEGKQMKSMKQEGKEQFLGEH